MVGTFRHAAGTGSSTPRRTVHHALRSLQDSEWADFNGRLEEGAAEARRRRSNWCTAEQMALQPFPAAAAVSASNGFILFVEQQTEKLAGLLASWSLPAYPGTKTPSTVASFQNHAEIFHQQHRAVLFVGSDGTTARALRCRMACRRGGVADALPRLSNCAEQALALMRRRRPQILGTTHGYPRCRAGDASTVALANVRRLAQRAGSRSLVRPAICLGFPLTSSPVLWFHRYRLADLWLKCRIRLVRLR